MKKELLTLCILFFFKISLAQIDSSDYKALSFCLYKTEEDFFNKKKSYRGQCLPSEDKKVISYTTNSKRRSLNLGDSCYFYFAYEIGDEIQIRPDKNAMTFTYYTFGGGTKDYYCVVYGNLPNYDRKGYLLGLTSPATTPLIYFVDHVNNLNMVQLPEFLKSKPNLLEQYKAEKIKMLKQDWDRNKLATSIKYLKLFLGEKK